MGPFSRANQSFSKLDNVLFTQEQTPLHPGNCWCFSGGEGHLVVSLAQPAAVSHVTLGHISKSQSPSGNTSSAPRKFSVYVRNPISKLVSGEAVDSDSFQPPPSSCSSPGLVEHQGSRSVPGHRDLQHRRSVLPDVQARGEWTTPDVAQDLLRVPLGSWSHVSLSSPPPEPQRGLLLLREAAGAQQLGQQGLHLHLQLQDPRQHVHLRARWPPLGGAWPGRTGGLPVADVVAPQNHLLLISSPLGARLRPERSANEG